MESLKIHCSRCSKGTKSFHYRCVDCIDYILCSYCHTETTLTPDHSKNHFFIRFNKPPQDNGDEELLFYNIAEIRSSYNTTISTRKENVVSNLCKLFEPHIHKDVTCDECYNAISGYRFKCLICENFDLCSICEHGNDHYGHMLLRITEPIHSNEQSKNFVNEIMRINSQSFEETNYEQDDSNFPNIESLFRSSTSQDNRFLDCPDKIEEVHPYVECDICRMSITGIRFKCIDCPDFDLCGSCEIGNSHSEHLLIRFIDPLHTNRNNIDFLNRIMEIRMSPTIEELYQEWPNIEDDQDVSHAGVVCNNCEHNVGEFRYMCLDCLNFELCSQCQKRCYHLGHLFIRLVEPLSKNQWNETFVAKLLTMRADVFEENRNLESENLSANNEPYPDPWSWIDLESELENVFESELPSELNNESNDSENNERYPQPWPWIELESEIENVFEFELPSELNNESNDSANNERYPQPWPWIELESEIENVFEFELPSELNNELNESETYSSYDSEWTDYEDEVEMAVGIEHHDENVSETETDPVTDYSGNYSETEPEIELQIQNETESSSVEDVEGPSAALFPPLNNDANERHREVQSCTICLDNQSNRVFQECGHLCICSDCVTIYMTMASTCPLCRTDIRLEPIRVYY